MTGFPPVVAIVGPTAVGKSRLALVLASAFGGDIISADSRQVYRYMDIGTDKPSWEDRAAITHHLLDVVSPADGYSAQRFGDEGGRVLRRLAAERRPAFVVGGTGFYVRSLLDGRSLPSVPPDEAFRAALRAEANRGGPEILHRRLARVDPESAARIHPTNLPRVIRALEIVAKSGKPVPPQVHGPPVPALRLGIEMDRDQVRERADRRIVEQMEHGMLTETRLLLEMGYDPASPALQGFGYRQLVAYLEGRCSLDRAVGEYHTATHRFIRRQLTWFRADARILWLPAGENLERRAMDAIRDYSRDLERDEAPES